MGGLYETDKYTGVHRRLIRNAIIGQLVTSLVGNVLDMQSSALQVARSLVILPSLVLITEN